MSWDEFISIMRGSSKLRDGAKAVVRQTVLHLKMDHFHFASNRQTISEEPICENASYMSQLYDEGEGEYVIQFLMFQAQIAHFIYLAKTSEKSYTWDQYISDLQHNNAMLHTLITSFYDGLQRIDFTSGWYSEEIEEIKFLHIDDDSK